MQISERENALRECFASLDKSQLTIIENTIADVIFLEEQLKYLKTVPHIKVHPSNPNIQKITPAGKLFKDSYNSYVAGVKLLLSVLKNNEIEEESPLQQWLKSQNPQEGV